MQQKTLRTTMTADLQRRRPLPCRANTGAPIRRCAIAASTCRCSSAILTHAMARAHIPELHSEANFGDDRLLRYTKTQ